MNTNFEKLLFRTAFSCMACDGEIANDELELIRKMSADNSIFGSIDIDNELNDLVIKINAQGKDFLKEFLEELTQRNLSEQEELDILNIAFKTIQADNKIEYSEIKFFKMIRSKMHVSNEIILAKIDGIDDTYLAKDINTDYLKMYDTYFNNINIPKFNIVEK
jgi:uncharacterized tellurite resistance protein B-like protein